MNAKTLFFCLIYLLTLPASLQASTIERIYEVTLPVVNQQRDSRNAAFEQALIEVAVRISGTSLAPTQLNIKQATSMVRQYRYQVMEQAEIDAYMKRTNTLVEPKYRLWIQFDDGKIKQMLKASSLPVWGYQRPNVLVWLAVKDGKNRYVLKQSDESIIKDAVTEEARRRGLPIVWPKYDAQDQQQLKFIDLWGQFWEPVKQASQRYGVDAVVLGRMNWINGSWQVNWSLSLEDKTENWQLTALDLGLLMGSGIGVATDHISSRFAVYSDNLNNEQLVVRIRNLNSVKNYARASRYLSSLAPVKNVFVTNVHSDYLDFHVDLSGNENDLKRIIALGRVLVPDNTPVGQDVSNPVNGQAQENIAVPLINNDAEQASSTSIVPSVPVLIPRAHILQYRLNG